MPRKLPEVYHDFLVVIRSANGQRHGSMTPAQFRSAMGRTRGDASGATFLGDIIEDYNARQAREGAGDRAFLELEPVADQRKARRRDRDTGGTR
jgi:hypothetical protein